MKLFKKVLSAFLAAVIMVSTMCVGTVNAWAAPGNNDGSPYYSAYYDKQNNTEQVILCGISEDELYFLLEETEKGNPLTITLKFTSGEQTLLIYYSFYKNIAQFPKFVTKGEFIALNDEYAFAFTLSPTLSEGARSIIKSAKTCKATIHITDNKTNKLKNYHNLNELFNIYVVDKKEVNKPVEKSISSLKISKPKSYTYTGKNRKASVTIKDGNYTLENGKDYTLTYKNCKNIGTASVTIKGKGDYTGSKTLTYKIVPKKTTLKAAKKSDSKVKLSWTAVKGAEKYQIYYSTNGGKYKKLATISGDKTSTTLSKLDFEKNDYKFKIRSYKTVDNKKYYSSYSKAITVK